MKYYFFGKLFHKILDPPIKATLTNLISSGFGLAAALAALCFKIFSVTLLTFLLSLCLKLDVKWDLRKHKIICPHPLVGPL